jgi:Glycosidases
MCRRKGHASGRDWFGGDLAGIEQHLDHVERVGANAIYMTPIFPATSTHRYDATSFDHVDPLLGGDAAFDSLARACAQRGIRLIGDLTTNHVGWKHDWFVAAEADHHAPERGFFYFDETLPTATRHGSASRACRSSTGATTSCEPDARRGAAVPGARPVRAGGSTSRT